MLKYKVLIADSEEDFCRALQEHLSPFCSVYCCQDGQQALSLIRNLHPEVLVLDLMLPKMDGISLLYAITADGTWPGILATSCYVSSYILKAAEDLGVAYLMEKPCSIERAAEVTRRLLQDRSIGYARNQYARVTGILLQLGVSPKLRGYGYLREAILRLAENPRISILKSLYPRIAANFGVSAEDVEHSIRSAVADAWNHRTRDLWELYVSSGDRKPSNAVLITKIAGSLEQPECASLAENI